MKIKIKVLKMKIKIKMKVLRMKIWMKNNIKLYIKRINSVLRIKVSSEIWMKVLIEVDLIRYNSND